MVEKLVLSVRVPRELLEKIDSEAIANEENRAAIVVRHLAAAYGLGEGDESLTPTALEKLTGQIEMLAARIEALERNQGKAIAKRPRKIQNSHESNIGIDQLGAMPQNFTDGELANGLNGKMLAGFLGISDGTLRSKKAMGTFTDEYIRSKDPDGKTWRFDANARWQDNLKDSRGGLWFRELD